MDYKKQFKHWDKLTFSEKLILKVCCYLPVRTSNSLAAPRVFKEFSFYQNMYERAFGESFWKEIKNKIVLDFGCGYGEYVLAMAMKGAQRVIGLDILDNFLVGKAKGEEIGLKNVVFIKGDSLEIPTNSVDVVTSHDAFEHYEKPEYILSEMVRIVKPGGFIFIKFGPTWMSPWGKHMFGTFRKDRPWIHLIFPERSIMRVHSVYHNEDTLLEKYADRPGGLNKMTVKKCRNIIKNTSNIAIEKFDVKMLYNMNFFKLIPLFNELFSSGVFFKLRVCK